MRSFVSVVPDVEDVLDDDGQRGQRTKGDAQVRDDGIRGDIGQQETASRTADADAEIANGIVKVRGHEEKDYGFTIIQST